MHICIVTVIILLLFTFNFISGKIRYKLFNGLSRSFNTMPYSLSLYIYGLMKNSSIMLNSHSRKVSRHRTPTSQSVCATIEHTPCMKSTANEGALSCSYIGTVTRYT